MREVILLLVEVLFALAFVAGVALINIPAALMVAGVVGVFAVERANPKEAKK